MDNEQIQKAIDRVITLCGERTRNGYKATSVRSALRDLEYESSDIEEIIDFVAEGGFTYCMDPRIEATHFDPNNPRAVNGMVTDRPQEFACFWGPDQVASRLHALRNYNPNRNL